jgi:hypothetical protein
MRKTTSISLVSLAAIGLALGANGQEFRTDINPALRYYQAFIMAPRYTRAFVTAPDLTEADYDYLFNNQWWGKTLPPRFGGLISNYDTQFRLVREAAQATVPCDWGIDFSDGPGTLLPHLAHCKAIAVTSKLRVLWDLQNGRETNACDDLLAVFTMARNTSRDDTWIGSLVQYADEALVLSSIYANFGRFSPTTLQKLVDGFDAAPVGPTLSNVLLIADKNCFVGWLERKIVQWQQENPGNDAAVLAKVRQVGLPEDGGTSGWESVLSAAGGTSGGILKLLQAMDPLYQQGAETLALPYPAFEAQAAQYQAQLDAAAATNPFIPIALANIDKARAREFRIQAWLAMVHAAVAYKSQGDPGLRSVNDPFGQGPFQFERFRFEGVDRGFKLTSAYTGSGYPEALIFVETEGTPFRCDGPHIGTAY